MRYQQSCEAARKEYKKTANKMHRAISRCHLTCQHFRGKSPDSEANSRGERKIGQTPKANHERRSDVQLGFSCS